MSANLAYRHRENIETQFDHLERYLSDEGLMGQYPFTKLLEGVEDELETVKERERLLEETVKQNPSTKQLRRIYAPHLSRLTNTRSRVEDLQQAILYHTLYVQQQKQYVDLLDYAKQVCAEIDECLELEATYLPVVWDAFASYGVIQEDYYAIHLPRRDELLSDSPLLAHELGHGVVDNISLGSRQRFKQKLERFVSEFRDRQRPLVRSAWQEWFPELLCDACGVLTFGPAYLSAIVNNLQSKEAYFLPRYPDEIGHPPDALRFRYVSELLDDRLERDVLGELDSHIERYEDHLSVLGLHKDAEYDSWIEQELLDEIETIADSQIEADLSALIRETFGDEPVSEARALRVEANRYHLGIRMEDD